MKRRIREMKTGEYELGLRKFPKGIKLRIAVMAVAIAVMICPMLMIADKAEAASIYGASVKNQYLRLDYTTSTSGSTTTISWSLYCVKASGTGSYKFQAPTTVYVNGSCRYSGNTSYDTRSGGVLLCSGTGSVSRSNGAAVNVPVSATVNMSGTTVGSISLSGSIPLSGYNIGSTSKSVTVNWDDDSNRDGKRPSSINVTLYQNGKAYKTAAVSASYTFTGLPAAGYGTAYTYTIGGTAVSGYTATASGNNITYTHVPQKTSITDKIKWNDDDNRDGKRPDIVTVKFYKNGEPVDDRQISVSSLTDYEYTFDDLYVYENGKQIEYTYEVAVPDEYTLEDDGNLSYVPKRTEFSGSVKIVEGEDAPKEVEVMILKDGAVYDTVTLSDENGWEYTFDELYVYENGEKINWQILPGRELKYRYKMDEAGNITYFFYKGKSFRLGFAV